MDISQIVSEIPVYDGGNGRWEYPSRLRPDPTGVDVKLWNAIYDLSHVVWEAWVVAGRARSDKEARALWDATWDHYYRTRNGLPKAVFEAARTAATAAALDGSWFFSASHAGRAAILTAAHAAGIELIR